MLAGNGDAYLYGKLVLARRYRRNAQAIEQPLQRIQRKLSDQTVARVVKRALVAAGRNAERFAGHSLRAGLATQAAMGGASERSIQEQTGHKSLIMLRRYIRDGSLFRENAAAKTGL